MDVTTSEFETTPDVIGAMQYYDSLEEAEKLWTAREVLSGVVAPSESEWNRVADVTVQGSLEILIGSTSDDSKLSAAMMAAQSPDCLFFEFDPAHLLSNGAFQRRSPQNQDYILLMYNETYTVLLCDGEDGLIKESQAGFSAEQFASFVTGADGTVRKAYSIPYEATEDNCYIFANAFDVYTNEESVPIVSIAANTLRIHVEEERASDDMLDLMGQAELLDASQLGEDKTIDLPTSVQQFLDEMFSPGLAFAPPKDIEVKVGDSARVPLGPTKD